MPITTKFDPGPITDAQLRDPAFVRGKFGEAVRAVAERDDELKRVTTQNEVVTARADKLEVSLKASDAELQSVKVALATEATRAQTLADRVKQLETVTPKISVQGLVTQFKSDVDKINREVLANPSLAGMLVDSVEVEVRGGLDVSQGVQITQLPPGELNGASASTLRFNLRPSVTMRIVDDA